MGAVNEEILYETRILELPFYEKTNNWLNLEPTISVNNVNTMTTLFNKLVRAAENGEELNNITRGMLLLDIS